jgi:hypothetical protein
MSEGDFFFKADVRIHERPISTATGLSLSLSLSHTHTHAHKIRIFKIINLLKIQVSWDVMGVSLGKQ